MAKKRPKPSSDTHSAAGVQVSQVKKSVRISFPLSPEINPVFANQMLVQADESTTYLSFFVVHPPVILGSEDEVQKQINELDEVSAKMVAQVIIPRERMILFVEAMTSAIKRESSLKAAIEGHADSKSARLQS